MFYIDASTVETINNDLKTMALAKKAGGSPSDTLAWLARQQEKWLAVYNNTDDTSLDLRVYFHARSHGSTLITTRNHRMITLAQRVEPEYNVSEMLAAEAQILLEKTAGCSANIDEQGATLVQVRCNIFQPCASRHYSHVSTYRNWGLSLADRPGRRIHSHTQMQKLRLSRHAPN